MCYVQQVKWHPCLFDGFQKLNKAKLDNIRKEYKRFFSWLKPFLRYGGLKICNFVLFCWQHCWSNRFEILI
ncbi:hypothetical protein O3M35_002626 [Rhynocoris fuscipes]|uniref:Uncharacterized protein n=1 Tax=Rhynocoris fuscipes TaxID=488301 RepID=A0AAW1CKZ0_9HEMI